MTDDIRKAKDADEEEESPEAEQDDDDKVTKGEMAQLVDTLAKGFATIRSENAELRKELQDIRAKAYPPKDNAEKAPDAASYAADDEGIDEAQPAEAASKPARKTTGDVPMAKGEKVAPKTANIAKAVDDPAFKEMLAKAVADHLSVSPAPTGFSNGLSKTGNELARGGITAFINKAVDTDRDISGGQFGVPDDGIGGIRKGTTDDHNKFEKWVASTLQE